MAKDKNGHPIQTGDRVTFDGRECVVCNTYEGATGGRAVIAPDDEPGTAFGVDDHNVELAPAPKPKG